MKQLRAIFDLSEEIVGKRDRKEILASARRLKDAFSRERDAYVMAALHASLEGRRQVASRQKRFGVDAARPERSAGKAAKIEAARLLRRISNLGLERLSWEQVFDAYVRTYRAARVAMKACRSNPSPERFHRWRRPVKDLFFQSQALRPLDGTKKLTRLARRLGERLGEYNDLDMLEKDAGSGGGKGIFKRIAKRKRVIEQTAFKIGAKLFSSKPRELARALEDFRRFNPRALEQCLRRA